MRLIQSHRPKIWESTNTMRNQCFECQGVGYSNVGLEDGVEIQNGEGIISTIANAAKFGRKVKNIGSKIINAATGEAGSFVQSAVNNRINSHPNRTDAIAGEKHLFMQTKHGITRANFAGPGTSLKMRLKRGDKPINQMDNLARTHDILYTRASRSKDPARAIRKADEKFMRGVDKVTDSGKKTKAVVRAMIKAKTISEDIGITDINTFTDIKGSGMAPGLALKRKMLKNIKREKLKKKIIKSGKKTRKMKSRVMKKTQKDMVRIATRTLMKQMKL
jgi:hypothetical protein